MESLGASGAAGGRRALLVGIDAYAHVGPLEGCVNDVRLMRALLVDRFGFPPAQVAALTDGAATRDGILAALDALVAATRPGDAVVIHYAGHGSRMTDREGDEASGMDNTLVPVDSGRDWRAQGGANVPNRDITDDELALRLAALAERTPNVTVIVDACHSGTITRDALGPGFGVRSRGVEPDTRPVTELPPSPVPPGSRARALAPRGGTRDDGRGDRYEDGYVLIAGCRDEERSYEHRAAADAAGGAPVPHGALTYFLARELAAAAPAATYRDVFERAAARVTAANRQQHPQIEGRADRELFGVRELPPVRHVRVLDARGDRVTLGTGAALGAAAGARYAVYPPGTASTDGVAPLGEVEIERVGAAESTARVLGAAAVPAGARAVERTRGAHAPRLRVQLVGAADDAAFARLRAAAEASPLLDAVAAGASVRVYLLATRDGATGADSVPQLGPLAEPTWAAVGEDGQLVAPPKPSAAVDDVVANLETIARFRRTLALANPDPASALRGRFRLELLRRTRDERWEPAAPGAGGLVVYRAGERVGFRITSAHDAPVYVNLVDLGPTGRIALVYPPAGAQDALAPGVTLDLVGRAPARRGWEVRWPDGFPFTGVAGGAPTDEGVETVKLFATTAPADFTFLSQRAVRSLGRPSTRAERIVRDATAPAPRDLGDDDAGGDDEHPGGADDWTTVERTFVIRRA